MNPDATALSVLAAPGGPLEVRRARQAWTGAPQFAELVAQLYPIELDILEFIDGHKVEIAPDDFTAQDVPREALRRYFDLTHSQLDVVLDSLGAYHLAKEHAGVVGLTATAVGMLASRPAPPR